MSDAIADAGPVLHLHEIGRLRSWRVFDRLWMPDLVAQELRDLQVDPLHLDVAVTIVGVESTRWSSVVGETGKPVIHPADAQVFVLAQSRRFRDPVLTDDLALRRRLENEGATVVGTIGVLVRAYSTGRLERAELESAVDALFVASTLRMSRAFRAYVRRLLSDLP